MVAMETGQAQLLFIQVRRLFYQNSTLADRQLTGPTIPVRHDLRQERTGLGIKLALRDRALLISLLVRRRLDELAEFRINLRL